MRVADPRACSGEVDDPAEADLATFLSMPLRGAGAAGREASSACSRCRPTIPDGFGDAAMTTLRLLEAPAGLVVDNGRLREHTLHAAVAGALPRPAGPDAVLR